MPGKGQHQAKDWCFTLNNWTDEEQENLRALAGSGTFTYIVWGRETGESGTPHLQGYLELPRRKRRNAVRELGLTRGRLTPRAGTQEEAANYCKKDGDFEEHGILVVRQPGRRSDLELIRSQLRAGVPTLTIADENFGTWIQYRRSFDEYRALLARGVKRLGVFVYVIHGRTGVGKTRFVYQFAEELGLDLYRIPHPDCKWFDGYIGQKMVLLDDYRGEANLSFFLQLLDRYPMDSPVKGSFVPWRPTLIFITSNYDPRQWHEEYQPVERRITNQVNMDDDFPTTNSWSACYQAIQVCLGLDGTFIE